MRTIAFRTLAIIGLAATLAVFATGCITVVDGRAPTREVVVEREAPDKEIIYVDEGHPGRVHDYYYYPDVEVYFDPVGEIWFWLDVGAWHHGRVLPRHFHPDHNHRRHFRSDAPHPYDVHDRVRGPHVERGDHDRRGDDRGGRDGSREGLRDGREGSSDSHGERIQFDAAKGRRIERGGAGAGTVVPEQGSGIETIAPEQDSRVAPNLNPR